MADFRVAVLPPIAWLPVDVEVVTALDELATQLGRVGSQVQVTQPEVLGDLRDYFGTYVSILAVWSTVGRPREECLEEAKNERRYATTFDSLAWADGLEASASDYMMWFRLRDQYRAALQGFFREWDVYCFRRPTLNAFAHLDAPRHERQFDVNGKRVQRYGWQSVYPSLATLVGHPATAFPVGQTRSGLPIGVQVIGPCLEDRTPIRFATLVNQEFGGYHRPRGYD
jgi:amidase